MKLKINTKAEKGLLLTDIIIIVAIFVIIMLIVRGIIGFNAITKNLKENKDGYEQNVSKSVIK